ncbi:MAG: APC family permease [Myxococcales bacterium]|nr:APC family permease [Myxococcales bacterium]
MTSPAPPPQLRRSIRLGSLVLYGLGTTIGAGIYALTGVIAGRAGMFAPVAFLLASCLAAFTALSFAELSARLPRAGGEAVYVEAGLGSEWLSLAVGLLVTLAGVVSAATVSTAFVGYLAELVPVPRMPAVAFVVCGVGLVAGWGVGPSVRVAAIITLVEIGGLVLVAVTAGEHWAALPARAAEFWPGAQSAGWAAVASAAVLAFYAFLGFEDMVNVAEEVQDVRRTLPRAILLTLGITTLLYAVTATAALLVVPPHELAASEAPLALVYERSGGSPALLGVIAVFAMLNGALIQVMKSSRVLYGMASMGRLPARLARVHPRTQTPLLATGLATAVALVLALALPLEQLAAVTSGITLVTFALANLALVALKRRDPHPKGVRTVPGWIPVVGFVVSVGFVGFELFGT